MIFVTKKKQDKYELVSKPGSRNGGEGTDQVGLDSRGRLKGEDPACPEEIDRDLGGDLAGQEQPEARMGLQGVELFLKGDQPAGRQVDVLEHDPPTVLDGCVDGLVSLTESIQVWSLFYSVDFSQSRIGVKKCVFNKHTIKVCVRCDSVLGPSLLARHT